MVTVTHEVAQKVSCVVCGKEKFAMKAPYICHGCWENGEAALMIQRLTSRALDTGLGCHSCALGLCPDGNGGFIPCTICGNTGQPKTAPRQ